MANRRALAIVSGQIQEVSASVDTLTVGSLTTVGDVAVGGIMSASASMQAPYAFTGQSPYLPSLFYTSVGNSYVPVMHTVGTSIDQASFGGTRYGTSSAGAYVMLGHSHHATFGSQGAMSNSDVFGALVCFGSDGTDFHEGGRVQIAADGASSAGSTPGRIDFYTTATGAISSTLALRLRQDSTAEFQANIYAPRLRLSSTTDASVSSTGHGFQVGDDAGPNVIIDGNEIMARDTGAVSPLYVNNDGGVVMVGPGGLGVRAGKLFATYGTPASAPSYGSAGDVFATRSSTTGAIYFGESSTAYLYFNGSKYAFGSDGYLDMDVNALCNGFPVGYKNRPRSTTASITDVHVGYAKAISANITIPTATSTFTAGDYFTIYNNSGSAITITPNATGSYSMKLAGSASTGVRTIAQRGMAEIWFNTATEMIVWGAGVT